MALGQSRLEKIIGYGTDALPAFYVRDSGLVHALLGIGDREALLAHPVAGASWEGLAVESLIAAMVDESLRARDPAWGIRQLDDVAAQAERHGLALQQRHAMPANNLLLVFAAAAS